MGEITLLQGLIVYGPLGVIAALGIYGTIIKDRECRDARTVSDKLSADYAKRVEEQAKGHAQAMNDLAGKHALIVAELAAKHDKRMDEMHTRFTGLAATLVDRSQALFDKVGTLADALARRSDR